MHSEADVAPAPVVVPAPQLTHPANVDVVLLYEATGQVWQLGVVAPSAYPQPLPITQVVGHSASTHSTTRLYDCHAEPDQHFQSEEVKGSSPLVPAYTPIEVDPQPPSPMFQSL